MSKNLVKIIQPNLNKSQHEIINALQFIKEEAKIWKMPPTEIQVSYDVTNLYPSVPLLKAIDVIVKHLKIHLSNFKIRAKLTSVDTHWLSYAQVNTISLFSQNVTFKDLKRNILFYLLLLMYHLEYLNPM